MILDLKNRAFVLKYLNIFPEVTPEIPYEQIRKYIMGSKAGHVMIYGKLKLARVSACLPPVAHN